METSRDRASVQQRARRAASRQKLKTDEDSPESGGKPKILVYYLSEEILKRKLGEVTAEDILHRFLEESKARAAFYYCVSIAGAINPVGIGTYPQAWMDIYGRNGYLGIDPIAERAFTLKAPIVWSQMTGLTDEQKRFMEESAPWIGKQGVTIPLGVEDVAAGISVTSDDSCEVWRDKLPNIIWNASIAGHKIHSIVLQNWKVDDDAKSLTQRQVEYLSLIASGLEVEDIAKATHTSMNAVKRVLDAVQRKLKVNSHSQAVAKAATLGQISL